MKKLLLILIIFFSCKIIDKPPQNVITNTAAEYERDSVEGLQHDFDSAHETISHKVESLDQLAKTYESNYGNKFNEHVIKRPDGDTAHVFYWLDDKKNIKFISERKRGSDHYNLWMGYFRGDTIFKLKICYLDLGSFDIAAAYYLKDTSILIGRLDFQRILTQKKHLLQDTLFREINLIK